ncbi:unnamed protein product [Cylindrotheca closterium]|uniref:Transmembrane protein n=1 Tax=Cylindrotheca closterium TaxID=2856 RepID=A0AAD2CRC7_9STRA|nr:unnamed protein product [Cylindrotheca closterium]
MIRSFFLTALLFLLGTSHHYVKANDYAEILSAVGECFSDESADVTTTLTCLSAYTECFDETSVTEVQTCVQDANATATSTGTDITAADVQGCIDSYVACITTEYQEIIDSLPACMNTTITDLGNCYIDNADTCNSTCSESDLPATNPYASASATSILVCQAFQSDIMDPTCEVVDCCQPCIDEFETFMNCIAQDALSLQTAPPQSGDCVVSCSSSSSRRLELVASIKEQTMQHDNRMLAGHTAEKLKAEEIYGLCAKLLETASVAASNGGGGNTPPAIPVELAQNLVEGLFQKCVVEKLDQLMDEYATESSESSTSGAFSNVLSFSYGSVVTLVVALGSFLV